MEESELSIFLAHGKSPLCIQVARFIENELELEVILLEERANRGRTIIEKLEDEIEDCDFAIIIMTAEDEQKEGEVRARQNVVHEIGFCQGTLGRENVLVLRQNSVEEFSNISGIVYEPFEGDAISSTFERIRRELRDAEDDYENNDDDDY